MPWAREYSRPHLPGQIRSYDPTERSERDGAVMNFKTTGVKMSITGYTKMNLSQFDIRILVTCHVSIIYYISQREGGTVDAERLRHR